MRRGDIDPNFEDRMDIMVVDQELIFSAIRKKWKFWDYNVGLTDFHRKVIKFLIDKRKRTGADQIIVVSINVPEKFSDWVVSEFLMLNFGVTQIDNEQTYKTWLSIIDPVVHYSTYERMNYHRATVQMTEEILANKL